GPHVTDWRRSERRTHEHDVDPAVAEPARCRPDARPDDLRDCCALSEGQTRRSARLRRTPAAARGGREGAAGRARGTGRQARDAAAGRLKGNAPGPVATAQGEGVPECDDSPSLSRPSPRTKA